MKKKMKFQAVFLAISTILVVCQADLPGLPFLQRALFNKRTSNKLIIEENIGKAMQEVNSRVNAECYPLAMV